jgi:hypothetical protein
VNIHLRWVKKFILQEFGHALAMDSENFMRGDSGDLLQKKKSLWIFFPHNVRGAILEQTPSRLREIYLREEIPGNPA